MEASLERQFSQSPESVLRAVEKAAELSGAAWQSRGQGGLLSLPAVQGLRQGMLTGRLHTVPSDVGTLVHLEIEESHFTINWSAAGVLLLGGLGGLTLVLWPLSPKILQVAPVGAVLAVVAWLLVVSRLRYSDAGDFLDLVAELVEHS
jgi:hypothetical protein